VKHYCPNCDCPSCRLQRLTHSLEEGIREVREGRKEFARVTAELEAEDFEKTEEELQVYEVDEAHALRLQANADILEAEARGTMIYFPVDGVDVEMETCEACGGQKGAGHPCPFCSRLA